jgi:hypothetical protein
MKDEKSALMTAGNIAKKLAISDAKVKKAIKELGIKSAAKKGVCNYYSPAILNKIKSAVK